MIIHSITLDNVKGVEHLELKDLPENGVIRISGKNERGKSTIMDALHVFLTCGYGSKNKEVKNLKPIDKDVSPKMSVVMTVGEYRLRMVKSFLKKRSAELTIDSPSVENLTGEEAESRFKQIIDANVDENLRDKLFFRQDGRDNNKGEIEASGIPPVVEALQNNAESSSDDDEIVKRARKKYEEYWTKKKGQPKEGSQYKYAQEKVNKSKENREAAKGKVDSLRENNKNLEKAKCDIERIEKEELPRAKNSHKQCEDKLNEFKGLKGQLDSVEKDLDGAEKEFSHADEAQKARNKLNDDLKKREEDVDKAKNEQKQIQEELEGVQNRHQRLKGELDRVNREFEQAKEAEQKACQRRDDATDGVDLAEHNVKVLEIVEKREASRTDLDNLEELEGCLKSALSTQPETVVTKEQFDKVREAKRQFESLRDTLQKDPASLTFSGEGVIEVDGKAIVLTGEPIEVTLVKGSTLRIGQVEATYSSGTGGPSRQDVQKAQEDFINCITDVGVQDFEAVRAARDATEVSEDLIAKARKNLEDEQRRIGTVAVVRQKIKDLDAELEKNDVPKISLTEAKQALDKAKEDSKKANEDYNASRRELDKAEDKKEEAEKEVRQASPSEVEKNLAGAKTRLEGAEKEYKDANLRLEAAKKEREDADIKKEYDSALLKKNEFLEKRDQLRDELDTYNERKINDELNQAEKYVAKLNQQLEHAKSERDRAKGSIEASGDPYGEFEEAQNQLEAAEREYDRVKLEAEAVKRLLESLESKQKKARERYAEPFREELVAQAQVVFGGKVDFKLNDKLAIEARIRDGKSIGLKQLSTGALEQLDLISRLVIAKIAGRRVPVFLDDALGSTDAERLQRVGQVIAETAKDKQVFLLTCEPERFDSVPDIIDYPMDMIAPLAEEPKREEKA